MLLRLEGDELPVQSLSLELHLIGALLLADPRGLLAYFGELIAIYNPASGKNWLQRPYSGRFTLVYDSESEKVEHIILHHIIMGLEP